LLTGQRNWQAAVVAHAIIAHHHGRPASETYDGHGICHVEFGHDRVARVDVTFRSGEPPAGQLGGPSQDYAADKSEFGTSRIRRWFARDWTSY
jgi:sulfide:quinone oxidoreductase